MSKAKSFNDRLNEWQKLADNLTPHLPDLPNLAADQGSLSSLVGQTRALQAQQEVHLAALRGVISQRNVLAAQASKARNRLTAGLQSAFDHSSDKLLEFGIRPRVRKSNLRLTKLQKAENAASRAAARAAALAAENQPAGSSGGLPSTAAK